MCCIRVAKRESAILIWIAVGQLITSTKIHGVRRILNVIFVDAYKRECFILNNLVFLIVFIHDMSLLCKKEKCIYIYFNSVTYFYNCTTNIILAAPDWNKRWACLKGHILLGIYVFSSANFNNTHQLKEWACGHKRRTELALDAKVRSTQNNIVHIAF